MREYNLNKYLLFVIIIFSLVACEKKTDGEKDLNISKKEILKGKKVEVFDEKKYEIKSEGDFKRNNNYAFEEAEKGNIDIAISILEFNLAKGSTEIYDYALLIQFYKEKTKAGDNTYLKKTKEIYDKGMNIYKNKKELTLNDKEDYIYLNFNMGNMQDHVDFLEKDNVFDYYSKIPEIWDKELEESNIRNILLMYIIVSDRYYLRGKTNEAYKIYKQLYDSGKKDEDIVSLLGLSC